MLSTCASDKRTRITRGFLGILSLILCLVFLCPAAALAEDGDGSGGGSGGNKSEALTLMQSYPADGQADLPTDITIELDFNKNVCNVTELASNAQCVHLTNAEGSDVAAHLLFPDTQVQRELRHEIFLQPDQPLSPDSQYRIFIDDRLLAKNGTSLDHSYTLTFTTGAQASAAANEKLTQLGDFVVSYETTPAGSSAQTSQAPQASGAGPSAGHLSRLLAILLIAAVVIFTIAVRRFRRGGR